jgi:RES domain-containing protein
VTLWRLVSRKEADDPLDGEGSHANGGRWNPEGVRVVYTSTSLALATLEQLVDLDDTSRLPRGLVAVRIAVPDDVEVATVGVERLPRSWRRDPPPRALPEIGARWVERASSLLLRVPSAVVPAEANVLVNPLHPDVIRLRIVGRDRYTWDPRLRRGGSGRARNRSR